MPKPHIPAMVTTCPRPNGASYLDGTLASLKQAGFEFIYETHGDGHDGAYGTFRRAAAYMLRETVTDWIAFFQDDVAVSEGLHDFLGTQPWNRQIDPERLGCISLYTAGRMTERYADDEVTWKILPLDEPVERCLFGACGMLWPRERLWEFLEAREGVEEQHRVEVHIARWCLNRELDYVIHLPESFVQHVGAVSAITNHRFDFGCTIPERCATQFLPTIVKGND